jgi:ubiquitin-protein ligase
MSKPPTHVSAYLKGDGENLREWTATVIEPSQSPYENGIFQLELYLPSQNPFILSSHIYFSASIDIIIKQYIGKYSKIAE